MQAPSSGGCSREQRQRPPQGRELPQRVSQLPAGFLPEVCFHVKAEASASARPGSRSWLHRPGPGISGKNPQALGAASSLQDGLCLCGSSCRRFGEHPA